MSALVQRRPDEQVVSFSAPLVKFHRRQFAISLAGRDRVRAVHEFRDAMKVFIREVRMRVARMAHEVAVDPQLQAVMSLAPSVADSTRSANARGTRPRLNDSCSLRVAASSAAWIDSFCSARVSSVLLPFAASACPVNSPSFGSRGCWLGSKLAFTVRSASSTSSSSRASRAAG